MLGIVGLFLVAGFLLARFAPARAGSEPAPAAIAVAAARAILPSVVAPAAPAAEPTPFFATFRGVKLRLPIAPADITVVAFHQASYSDAIPMVPLVGRASLAQAAAAKRAARSAAASATTSPAAGASVQQVAFATPLGVWSGRALSLWRSGRAGAMNSAIDCGARPGTAVYSPVDGTVMEIRAYKLYGKYSDFEIHIKPDAFSDVDLVILHTTEPHVTEGQHVVAGVDQISSVRKLAGVVSGIQLGEYTTEGGNHCHVQFNRISKPDDPWLVGQDPPGLVRRSP